MTVLIKDRLRASRESKLHSPPLVLFVVVVFFFIIYSPVFSDRLWSRY